MTHQAFESAPDEAVAVMPETFRALVGTKQFPAVVGGHSTVQYCPSKGQRFYRAKLSACKLKLPFAVESAACVTRRGAY